MNTKGVTAIEYGPIGALISIVIMGGLTLTGTETKDTFCKIDQKIGNHVSFGTAGGNFGYDAETVDELEADGITPDMNASGLEGVYLDQIFNKLSDLLSVSGNSIESIQGIYDLDGNAITSPAIADNIFVSHPRYDPNNLLPIQTAGGGVTDDTGFTPYFDVTSTDGQIYQIGTYQDANYGKNTAFKNITTGVMAWTGHVE